jgi:phosphatidylglycerol:prolipoprotein diacylglycerol transferase
VHVGPPDSEPHRGALLVGIVVTVREGERRNIAADAMLGRLLPIVVGALAGSRIAYWLEHADTYRVGELLAVWRGGLSLFGGICGAAAGTAAACRLEIQKCLETWDAMALAFALGLTVGRIGCLLNGCDFGAVTPVPWAIRFPSGSAAHALHLEKGWIAPSSTATLPVHPTQLYEALFGVGLFFFVRARGKECRRPGTIAIPVLALYCGYRLLIESYREPTLTLAWGVLTPGRLWAAAFLALGALLALRERLTPPAAL